MIKVAMYKGTHKGISGVYNRGVRWLERGSYSHCELIFSDGMSASSSFVDGGVRYKQINYSSDNWDFIDVSWADEVAARSYFDSRVGQGYDLLGNLHFLIGAVKHSEARLFCSEAVAEALGIEDGWLIAPNNLYNILVFINQQLERQHNMYNYNLTAGPTDQETPPDDLETGDGHPPVKPPVKP